MSEAVCTCGCPWRMHDTDTMIAPCRQCWCFEFKRDTRRGKKEMCDYGALDHAFDDLEPETAEQRRERLHLQAARAARTEKAMDDHFQDTEDQGVFLGTASFVSTTSNRTNVYPCDMGLGQPSGYHHFEASTNGIVVCRYCGKKAS